MNSFQSNIPQRLRQNGRPVDPLFSEDEKLYRRVKDGQVESGRLIPISIDLPSCSSNRSKYSEPEDVLLPSYHNWGIAVFLVKDVPPKLIDDDSSCDFRVEHVPEPENYSHTEIRSYHNGRFDQPKKPGNKIKKQIRQIISDRAQVIKYPTP